MKARKDPKHRFRLLSRLLDRGMLRESFHALKRKAAPGIDGLTHAKFRASLRALKEWLREVRCGRLGDLLVVLRRKLQGYWNYYGVIGNSKMTARYQRYQQEAMRLLYKWLNRRSQRRSMTWKQFTARQPGWKLPPPRVVERRGASALPSAAKSV